ncbi:MAG TPA: periplasmic heavy metal sensor [Burkholderiales bacterium]|nr:periplasmic heavy metal sensor [Burkholderiales bacterium]
MTCITRMAFITILASAMALPAAAQQRDLPRQPPGDSMHGMMQGGMMGMMGSRGDAAGRERPQLTLALQNRAELGLTEPQGRTLQTLVERFRSSAEQRIRELEAAETELASLLKQDPPAGPEVEARVRRIEKLRADLRLERIRTIAEGRAALAPEQRAKLDQLVASSAGGMRGMHRGGMEGMGRGPSDDQRGK